MIIFTDLDGSLLNHSDYSYYEAHAALKKIRADNIPLIMCTSKTRNEVETLHDKMGLKEPFIVENGGGIFFPRNYRGFRIEKSIIIHNLKCIPLGVPYGKIRTFMNRLGSQFSIKGFGDMTEAEISSHTGLPRNMALQAKAREFTEPFLIKERQQLSQLENAANENGIKITRGGRFFHFIGSGNDKGEAVKLTKAIFERNLRKHELTVGLGDSLNDLPMLAQVDIPVLIPHPNGRYEDINLPNLIRAPFPGSKGWNSAVLSILDTFRHVENRGWKFSGNDHIEWKSLVRGRRSVSNSLNHPLMKRANLSGL